MRVFVSEGRRETKEREKEKLKRRNEGRERKVRKRTLPLKNHSLEFVVEDEYLDTNVVLRSSSEFHSGHRE